MIRYSHIEERYCVLCKQTVGVETTRMADGQVRRRCLTRACGEEESARDCFFNTRFKIDQ